ncbi:MAG: ATP-binding cassette domain-containing protein [Verrucomicrobia bacterium]|nr:ATP-binding cassette domain-containing protein [Verrucomicrobiota bacterium]
METKSKNSLPGSKESRRFSYATAGMGGAGMICTIGQAVLLGLVVDRLWRSAPVPAWLFFALAAVILLRAIFAGGARWFAFGASAGAKRKTRRAIHGKILDLGPARSASERTGGLVHDTVEGVEALDASNGLYFPQFLVGLSAPLVICLAIGVMDWVSGLVLLVTAPLAPILLGLTQSRFRAVSARYHAEASALSARFLDAVQGLPTLKAFNAGAACGSEMAQAGERFRRETMKLLAVNQLAIFLLDWGFAVGATGAAFVVAALRWKAGAITVGEAVTIVLLSLEIIRQLNLLGAFFFAGAGGRAMGRRIRHYLDTPGPVKESETTGYRMPSRRDVRFEDVSFAYPGGGDVLSHVSFEIQPGETVGLLGASGAGKSSIVHLLLRFADPREGRILLGGRPLVDLPLEWLRSQIAWVAQDTWLFHGTVEENLRIAYPGAGRGEIEEASRAACIHDFITSLPEGYQTRIGERGTRLSGGQAQRLAIARALLKDAPIILLDEPTSHVDFACEAALRQALDRLSEGRTVLHITHRRHSLSAASRLFYLEDGRITKSEDSLTLETIAA